MDYATLAQTRLRTPEERRLAAAMAQSVMGREAAEAWAPEYVKEPALEQSNPEDWIPGPGTAKALALKAAAAAKGVGGMALAGGAGIIRKGGNPDLVAVHQTSPRKLWPWTQNERVQENFTAPSLAINNGRITQDFGDDSGMVTFVARPDALDPKTAGGYVFPRDVYTPRYEQFQEMAEKGIRPQRKDIVLGENAQANNPAHELSLRLAPRFRSYEAFERNPQGAGVLAEGMHPQDLRNMQNAWQSDLYKTLQEKFGHRMPADLGDGAEAFLKRMQAEAKMGTLSREELAAYSDFIKNYRNIPSEYAEQKLLGNVPVSAKNWAGAIIRENPEMQRAALDAPSNVFGKDIRMAAMYNNDENRQRLIQALTARGIPAVTTRHPEEEYYLAKWLSEKAVK